MRSVPGTLILLSAVIVKADTVLEWNIVALKTTSAAPFNPPVESRSLAIVHAAMFDAINSIIGEFRPYAVELSASKGASPDAAAAAAAHFALVRLSPAQQAPLDAAYAASLSGIPDGSAKTDGMAVGEDVAAKILAMRANDGAEAAIVAPYTSASAPGDWVPTPPASARQTVTAIPRRLRIPAGRHFSSRRHFPTTSPGTQLMLERRKRYWNTCSEHTRESS
jgi:hypothetical protein